MAKYTQRVSDEFIFDGDEGWSSYLNGEGVNNDLSRMKIVDLFPDNDLKVDDDSAFLGYMENVGILQNEGGATATSFAHFEYADDYYMLIPTSELGSDDATGFTNYLIANSVTTQYELATPITTQLTLDELWAFENGTLYNNSFGQFDYSTSLNKSAIITRLNETVEQLDDKIAVLTDKVNVTNYGIKWNKITDSYTRINNAWGKSLRDFDSFYPWSKMKRCNLADDLTVNAFYGDAGYIEDSTNGETMVQIPKFYYKTVFYIDDNDDEIREWYISEYAIADYKLHPAFINAGIEKDYCYISAYEGYNDGGTLRSKITVQPTDTQTIATFRTQAQVHGNGWGLLDFQGASVVQLLYLVEYAGMFAQNVLSEGITNLDSGTVNHSQNTGHTSSLGNASGQVISTPLENGATGDTETYPFSYRGIENFYGNIWKFVDGLLVKDDGYYVGQDIDNYSDAGIGYLKYNAVPIITNGYSKDFENLDNMDYAFMPNQVGGSSTTYTTDYLYAHNSTEVNLALLGADWSDGAFAGCFSWFLSYVASYSFRTFGARLLAK